MARYEMSMLFELRNYRAHPGQRERLIAMFEDVFLDAYEASGTRVIGTFRSLEEPDRWVWIRAFPDAASRGTALRNFYDGDTWRRHAEACNATIADIAPAWLLRESRAGIVAALMRAAPSAYYEIAVYPLDAESGSDATFVSDHSE